MIEIVNYTRHKRQTSALQSVKFTVINTSKWHIRQQSIPSTPPGNSFWGISCSTGGAHFCQLSTLKAWLSHAHSPVGWCRSARGFTGVGREGVSMRRVPRLRLKLKQTKPWKRRFMRVGAPVSVCLHLLQSYCKQCELRGGVGVNVHVEWKGRNQNRESFNLFLSIFWMNAWVGARKLPTIVIKRIFNIK